MSAILLSLYSSQWADREAEADLPADKGIVPNTRKDAHGPDRDLEMQDLRCQSDIVPAETAQGQKTEREVEGKGIGLVWHPLY